jgi:hypothetical protein
MTHVHRRLSARSPEPRPNRAARSPRSPPHLDQVRPLTAGGRLSSWSCSALSRSSSAYGGGRDISVVSRTPASAQGVFRGRPSKKIVNFIEPAWVNRKEEEATGEDLEAQPPVVMRRSSRSAIATWAQRSAAALHLYCSRTTTGKSYRLVERLK